LGAPPQSNSEIIAHDFFVLDALPATRARIVKIFFSGRSVAEIW
jgi:hypothetical protein